MSAGEHEPVVEIEPEQRLREKPARARHTQLDKLAWMNTGRDKREVRERDRQGQGNGERLFFQRHSFVFYWLKAIFWSKTF